MIDYEKCKKCPYYFGEINACLYGDEDVPLNMVKRCGEEASARTLEEALERVGKIDSESGIDQGTYVIEECAELVKELTKEKRGKSDNTRVVDEACDVLTTVLILLYHRGISEAYMRNQILFKCNRAIERYEENGEV